MRIRALVPLALAALSACTLTLDPDDQPRPGLNPSDAAVQNWAQDLVAAMAAKGPGCGFTPSELAAAEFTDPDAFPARLVDLNRRGTMVFDPTQAAACLAAIAGANCGDLGKIRLDPAGACQRAFRGTVGLAQPCASSPECGPSRFCDGGAGVCPGTCRDRVGPGQACDAAEGPLCAPDLFCVSDGTSSRCAEPFLGVGEVCDGFLLGCKWGLVCDGATSPPTCAPGGTQGNPCLGGIFCQAGLRCTAGICLARTPVGGNCTPNPTGDTQCVYGAFCNAAGTCVANPVAGQSCGWSGAGEQPWCTGSRCSGPPSDVCERWPTHGESCALALRCAPEGAGVGCVLGTCRDDCR